MRCYVSYSKVVGVGKYGDKLPPWRLNQCRALVIEVAFGIDCMDTGRDLTFWLSGYCKYYPSCLFSAKKSIIKSKSISSPTPFVTHSSLSCPCLKRPTRCFGRTRCFRCHSFFLILSCEMSVTTSHLRQSIRRAIGKTESETGYMGQHEVGWCNIIKTYRYCVCANYDEEVLAFLVLAWCLEGRMAKAYPTSTSSPKSDWRRAL